MWQEIAALTIVGATVALFAYRAIRNRRRGLEGGCVSCGHASKPVATPTYLIPSESLTAFAPKSSRSKAE